MNRFHQYVRIKENPLAVRLDDIPSLEYSLFKDQTVHILQNKDCRCIAYFARQVKSRIDLYMCISDSKSEVMIYSTSCLEGDEVESLVLHIPALHVYEREIAECYKITFRGHPWMKPLRYPCSSVNHLAMDDYPFYKIEGSELHEVGVGPIHAGVIEPGHFRFICNGERVLHLEIQLGYQHRGVEEIMAGDRSWLYKMLLSENVAGDSAVSHGLAFAMLSEKLSGVEVSPRLEVERVIAQELERIAMHIGDTAALCGDVAYQLGMVVCEALRTITINTTQLWCGNRFGKGIVRIAGTSYPLQESIKQEVVANLRKVRKEYNQLISRLLTLPSVLARFEGVGVVTTNQAYGVGAVGMAARMTNILRDVRTTNPYMGYKSYVHEPILLDGGDVMARLQLRADEVVQSIDHILAFLAEFDHSAIASSPRYDLRAKGQMLGISLVEGWRGEICHCAITDETGGIARYKVKDPSFHNWFVLALAVRNQEISDFPICNKSFNLSYCGNDL
jgi:Ni,Fe-hydrogenase III large subunit/NADH:ubiquinone oxidoreductase subunit C